MKNCLLNFAYKAYPAPVTEVAPAGAGDIEAIRFALETAA